MIIKNFDLFSTVFKRVDMRRIFATISTTKSLHKLTNHCTVEN